MTEKFRMFHGKVKNEFYKKLEEFASNKLVMYSCLPREQHETIIKQIKKAKVLQYLGKPLNPLQEQCMKKYDVIDNVGDDKLIAKNTGAIPSVKLILIKEETFDLLADVHLKNNHCLFKKIQNALWNYCLPDVVIQIFLTSCNVCKRLSPCLLSETDYFNFQEETPVLDSFISKESNASTDLNTNNTVNAVPSYYSGFNLEVYVALIDMRWNPDSNFEGLMCYYDIETGYLLLRAISDLINEQEITMELLQIFMDFGRPDKLLITDKNVYSQLGEIMKMCPEIEIKYNPQYSKHPIDAKVIVLMLQNWMTENFCENWAFGCRVVQYQYNTSKSHDVSPYSCVFSREPCNLFTQQDGNQKNTAITFKRMVKDKSVDDSSIFNEQDETNNKIDTEMQEESETPLVIKEEDDIKPEVDLELLTVEETQLLKIPPPTICYICNKLLSEKGYTCSVCQEDVHLYCCERFLDLEAPISSSGTPAMKTTCLVCKA